MRTILSLFQGSNLAFVVVFVVVAALLWWRRIPWNAWGAPFVSIGLLGTFYGILVALLGFDVENVQGSVPRLIDGMKTAFATSVFGVTVSVITQLVYRLQHPVQDLAAPTARDYLAEMRLQTSALEAIRAGIGGDSDSSLLVQIQKLRLDMQDSMKKLSAQSTDAIIKALQKVIQDFNAGINDQLGDNFKQLNEAVGRLVGWMEKHQELVTNSHAQLGQAIKAMEGATWAIQESGRTLNQVSQDMGTIRSQLAQTSHAIDLMPPAIEKVQKALAGLTGDAQQLANNVEALDRAVQTLSTGEKALTTATEQWTALAKQVPEMNVSLQGMVVSVRSHAEAVTRQQHQLILALQDQIPELAQGLRKAQDELVDAMRQALTKEVRDLGEDLQRSQTNLTGQLQRHLLAAGTQNQQMIDKQIQVLDKALGDELSKALNSIAGKLASLSEKFVQDYQPLTEQLAKVVQLARDIEAARQNRPTHG